MAHKLRKLKQDESKAEVIGVPGAVWQQDGILFNSRGIEVTDEDIAQPADDEIIAEDNPYDPNIGRCVVIESPQHESAVNEQVSSTQGESFETMHHMKLRKLLSIYGMEWKDRTTAIEQLRGMHKAA